VKNKQGVSLKSNRVLRKSYDNENQQMELYLKKYDKKEGAFKVKYNLPAHKWGRINPEKSLSLCVFHRPTRHAYCQGIYIDIDMKNAHPVIVKNICLLNNIPCPTITKYCEDRDAFLQRVCDYHNVDRASAKTLMLRLTYGGVYANWLDSEILKQQRPYNDLAEIVEYEAEMENIRNLVFENNTHIIADVEKADPSYFKNPKYKTPEDVLRKKKKTCMSHFCNTIERHLQEACIKYLVDNKGFDLFKKVPCQDGFMILFDLWYDDILKELEQVVFNKIGFNVELVVKEFDEACDIPVTAGEVEQPEEDGDEDNEIDEPIDDADFKETDKIIMDSLNKAVNNVNEDDNKILGFTDYDLANVVHHYCGGLFVCCSVSDNIWYEFKDHHWVSCNSGTSLRNFISKTLRARYVAVAENLIKVKKAKPSKKIDRMLHIIGTVTEKFGKTNDKNNIMRECRELFYKSDFEERLNENVHLICFTNGIFDSNTTTFRDGTPDDMCSMTTGVPLLPLTEEEETYKRDILQRMIYDPLGEAVGDYFLLNIALALVGKRMKRIMFGLGTSDAGKSTICKATLNSFAEYAYTFNAGCLAHSNTTQDEAQRMRWTLLIAKKRIIFSNEMKSNASLDGEMIKKN